MVKQRLRKQLRKALNMMNAEQIHQQSRRACEFLCGTAPFLQARVIMMFLSKTDEIETQWAIRQALDQGKTVAVPKVIYKHHQLIPLKLSSLDCEMETDRYGLRHPKNSPEVPVESLELVVAPGLGFDEHGHRLGRGGGYYDRFFCHHGFHALKCGFAFEQQMLDEVPMDQHDIPIDMLITDQKVRQFGNHKKINTGAKDG